MKKHHILIIDDSAVDRKVMRKVIEESNKDIMIIENQIKFYITSVKFEVTLKYEK